MFLWHMCLHIFQTFEYPKIGKKRKIWSDTHIADAKNNPFITFGPYIFAYLNHLGVHIKEMIIGKTASVFLYFWQNTGPKKPVCEPTPLVTWAFQ